MSDHFRVYFLPDPKGSRQYVKSTAGDVTTNPFEAKRFTLKQIVGKLTSIRRNLLGEAFSVDPGYACLPIWKGLDAHQIPVYHERIHEDDLEMMETGSWKRLLAEAKK